MFQLATLQKLWPHGNAKIPGLIEGIAAAAPDVLPRYGITSQLVIAHLMAQVSHECGAGDEVVENLNYSAEGLMKTWPTRFDSSKASTFAHQPQKIANEVYNGRMGNRPGTDDGWNYRGRGGTQTTGRDAYQRLGSIMALDLVNNPDLVNAPKVFLECAVADFVKLCDCLPYAEKDDVVMVTRKLNGGEIGLAERKMWLARWKTALAAEPARVSAVASPPVAKQQPSTVAVPPATKHVVAGGAVSAGAAAATQTHSATAAIVCIVVGIAIAFIVYLVWKKEK